MKIYMSVIYTSFKAFNFAHEWIFLLSECMLKIPIAMTYLTVMVDFSHSLG